ncbi:EAL domain-containing protein [Clostridium sp. ZS2-4]|uniref:EAL domain-containing protein n=1 Tax=Clostridium sp. ZS2-4 TaxID=2987703 RepID=UPI00227BC6D9|nr:EAL domain-containing protein [Clostridium sp. ZS2-4]MCY6353762.1 EAL domain-containing protein [Clostridium sp. ZS2-4]
MKTYNFIYEDFHSLNEYICKNNISSYNKILVQIYSGIGNKDCVCKIKKDILNVLPQAKVIGITSSGDILNENIINNSCGISITVFNNLELTAHTARKDNLSDFQCGQILGQKLVKKNAKVLIIFDDETNLNGEEFLRGIDSVSKESIIAGGLTASIGSESEAFIFNENKIVKDKTVGGEVSGKELKGQYYTDLLTGLPNRNRLTVDILKKKYRKLALIDINSFTELNDFYGNKVGDVILIELAKLMTYFAEEKGFEAYRIHANTFALVSSDDVDDVTFKEVLSNLQKIIKQQCFFYMEHKFFINVSVGIATEDVQLIEKADMALNYAKKHKKNFQIYDENLNILKSYENNLIWTKKINDAIEDDRIVPYFQPIFNNHTGKIEKFESLIRMIDKEGKVITPYYFLDIAKEARIYNELTRIVINKTVGRFKNTDYEFAINLSVEDILDNKTREFIIEKLQTSGLAKQIVFEIVESEGIENFSEVNKFIQLIKKIGAKIAIDDFGTGYSNFSYLIKLKVDYIKIDGSIIKNINKDKSAEVVAETIVSFAKKLGINTIAEFVSDEEIYKKVSSMDIDFSQGYYFSEPKRNI